VEQHAAKLGARHRSSVVELSIRNPARPAHASAGPCRFNELGEASDDQRWPETPSLAPPLAPRLQSGMTVLTATLTCPHCEHEKSERCRPTPARTSISARGAARYSGPSPVIAAFSAPTARADARPGRTRGHDYLEGAAVYSRAGMKLSLVRLVATLLLSGQMLPVGLPLLCDQVQRGTPASCEQRMASHESGPAVAATTHATPCANSAFCAITAPAVVAFSGTVSVFARVSHIVGFGVSTLAPADPQAPLPPPPQA